MEILIVTISTLALVAGTAIWESAVPRDGRSASDRRADVWKSPNKAVGALVLVMLGILLLSKAHAFSAAMSSVEASVRQWLESMPYGVTGLAFGLAIGAIMIAVRYVVRFVSGLFAQNVEPS